MTENQIVLIYDPSSRPARLHLTVHSFIDDWFRLCFIKQGLKSKAVVVALSVNCSQLHYHAYRTSSKLVFGGFIILKASICQIVLNTICAYGNTVSLCREFNLSYFPNSWTNRKSQMITEVITQAIHHKCPELPTSTSWWQRIFKVIYGDDE